MASNQARALSPRKLSEEAEGAQAGFLHDIVRLAGAAAQPAPAIVGGIQVRQRHLLEAAGLVGQGHGILLSLIPVLPGAAARYSRSGRHSRYRRVRGAACGARTMD